MDYVRTGGGYKCRDCIAKSKQIVELKSSIAGLVSENQRLVSELETALKEKEKLEESLALSCKDKTEEEDILKKIEELSKLL